MRKYVTILFFALCFSAIGQGDIESILPDIFDLPGMQTEGRPELYKGDNLFDLINGGAEVYLEYGFIQVLMQNYLSTDRNSNMRIEVYEFDSPESAFGIMSYSNMGVPIFEKRGAFRVSGMGYEYLQSGHYFVIITYRNLQDDLNISILSRTVSDILENIVDYAQPPNLFYGTKSPCPKPQMSLFFRGDLALRNMSYLGFKIPFNYDEGVAFKCDSLDYIVLLPKSSKTQKELVEETISLILSKNTGYTSEKTLFGFAIKNGDKLKFELRPEEKRFVLIKYE